MIRVLLLALLVLASCGGDGGAIHVPGGTLRVEPPVPTPGTPDDFELKIFTAQAECDRLPDAQDASCLPWVNRASSEVHLSFQPQLGGSPYRLPLTAEHIKVSHLDAEIRPGTGYGRIELIPHDPQDAPQLFILVIDGSSSMNEDDGARLRRIDRVRKALLMDSVVGRFFPEGGGKSGVVLLQFTDRVQPVGGEIRVIKNKGRYRQLVRDELGIVGGYTHLYDAIEYASGELLDDQAIKTFLSGGGASPTVIALTDGFNNEAAGDVCSDNVARLRDLLTHIRAVRSGADYRGMPTIHTVGLGKPLGKKIEDPELKLTGRNLCGKRANMKIDNGLENKGIDRTSLEWIAAVGGGVSFAKKNAKELGAAFQEVAAKRYGWFELLYEPRDGYWLRRAFETKVELRAFVPGGAAIRMRPSAWIDGPSGERDPDAAGRMEGEWFRPRPYRVSAAVAVPLLALLIVLGFVSAAVFNTRRALGGRKSISGGGQKPKG